MENPIQPKNLPLIFQPKQFVKTVGLNAIKTVFLKTSKQPTQYSADIPDGHSLLGTPIYDRVTFYGNGPGGSIMYYDIATKKPVVVPKLNIDIALINVTKVIQVVKTNVAGANGTVKQYISLGDYQVSINGVFTSEVPDTRPEDVLRQLNLLTSCPTEVQVGSHFLSTFGITCVVFDGEQNFNMEESQRDVQRFTLNCLSETPFLIKVQQQGATTSNNGFGQPLVVV